MNHLLFKELTEEVLTITIETESQPAMVVSTSKEDKPFKNKYFGIKTLRISHENSER